MTEEQYFKEKEDFVADKCPHCMSYLDKDAEDVCPNNFCEGKIPEDYK